MPAPRLNEHKTHVSRKLLSLSGGHEETIKVSSLSSGHFCSRSASVETADGAGEEAVTIVFYHTKHGSQPLKRSLLRSAKYVEPAFLAEKDILMHRIDNSSPDAVS